MTRALLNHTSHISEGKLSLLKSAMVIQLVIQEVEIREVKAVERAWYGAKE